VGLLRASVPQDSREVSSWPVSQRLTPHVLVAAEHAQRLAVAGAEVGWLLSWVSGYLWSRGQSRQARPIAERALALTEAALEPDDTEVGQRHDDLGRVLRALGDFPGARSQFERALAIHEAALGPDHPSVATDRSNLGLVLQDLGDLADARTQLERALEIGQTTIGPDHPNVAIFRGNLDFVLQELGE
jgi:tetratricopeptide (TPR) repeat protein